MKTIGLLGGMSWESSSEYYRLINEGVRQKLGGFHAARIAMVSVDFAEVQALQRQGNWDELADLVTAAAQDVERAGGEFLVICANTIHKLAEAIQEGISIPILHIADATAERIRARGLGRVGLLGTRFTMEEDFYKGKLKRDHGIEAIVPEPEEREAVNRVIFDELCMGRTPESSKAQYVDIIERLVDAGAEGVILGCTEIGLLIRQEDVRVPLFDTTQIHATAAVEHALHT